MSPQPRTKNIWGTTKTTEMKPQTQLQELTPEEEELLEQTERDFKISIIFESIIHIPRTIRRDIEPIKK